MKRDAEELSDTQATDLKVELVSRGNLNDIQRKVSITSSFVVITICSVIR
jgi:hypothetical protein